MARIFGFLAIVGLIWLAAEVYTKGADHAFGGVFAGWADPVVPLDELHSGGGRDGRAMGARTDPDGSGGGEMLVVEDEDPFEEKRTPVQRLGAHVQGQIDGAYERRNRER